MEIQQQILILLMFIFLVSLEQIIFDFDQSSLLRRTLKNLSSQNIDELTSVIKPKEGNNLWRKTIEADTITNDEELRKKLVNVINLYFKLREECMTNKEIKFKLSEKDSIISDIYSQLRSLVLKNSEFYLSNYNIQEIIRDAKIFYKNNGINLINNQKVKKQILTLNGPFTFNRTVLRPKDQKDKDNLLSKFNKTLVIPLDDFLGLSKYKFKMTVETMIEIAYWSQNQFSYERSEDAIKRVLNISINDDTIRLVSNHIGKIIFEHEMSLSNNFFNEYQKGNLNFTTTNKNHILYLETDGAALNTRIKSEDVTTWRENKFAIGFSTNNFSYHKSNGEKTYTIDKVDCISYIGKVEEFQKYFFWFACRNGYGQFGKTILISDGATWIRNMKNYLFPDVIQILDFYHLKAKLYDFGKNHFNLDKDKYTSWAERISNQFYTGLIDKSIKEIESMSSEKYNEINLNTYIKNNINNINYAHYLKKGYIIGSGAVESHNKTILQRRLKQAGMRWNVPTAQYLLTLVAKVESKLWDSEVKKIVLDYYNNLN
ncbi:MAG: hypothetical protein LBT38_06680 [Deltaproteobacteria bacterium]|jgi:hypothetical protein|nr:hypothetical protein [Deltaproteobacteria bacterium]